MKDIIRKKLLSKRLKLNAIEQENLSEKICNNLINMKIFKKENIKNLNISLFNSHKMEVDLTSFRKYLIKYGANCYYPITLDDEIIMEKHDINLDETQFISGKLGILEPQFKNYNFEKMDIVIVPGIGFDLLGNRIGHGKGYYDKYFAKYEKNNLPLVIAPIYSFQICDNILPSSHDVPVNIIVTENNVLNV